MIDALYIANSALRAQQQHLDVISNNVANLQTPGFKRQRVSFSEIATAPLAGHGTTGPLDALGAGTRIASVSPDLTDGELKPTLDPLDLAVRGAGLLEVLMPDGSTAYTRAGQLRIDRDGYLGVRSGQRLAAGIQVPPDATELRFEADGTVTAMLPGAGEPVVLGTLELVRFSGSDALEPHADNLYRATADAGDAVRGKPGEAGLGSVMQGYLEVSNVDMVQEMTDLVLAQRVYQLNARVLQASDQILETINNLRR